MRASKKLGFSAKALLVLLLLVVISSVIYFALFNSKSSKPNSHDYASIQSFSDCAKSNIGYFEQDMQAGISCSVDKGQKKFYANALISIFCRSDGNNTEPCASIVKTYEDYCKDGVQGTSPGSTITYKENTHSGLYSPKKIGTPRVLGDFAYARFGCSNNQSTDELELYDVYLKRTKNTFKHYLTVKEPRVCSKIDNQGIPVALSILCYDETSKFFRVAK